MMWETTTKKIDGVDYVVSCRIRAKGKPDYGLCSDFAIRDLADEDGLLLWTVIPNPDFDENEPANQANRRLLYVKNPQLPSNESIEKKRLKEEDRKVENIVSRTMLIEAVIDMKNGYTTKLDAIEEKIKDL